MSSAFELLKRGNRKKNDVSVMACLAYQERLYLVKVTTVLRTLPYSWSTTWMQCQRNDKGRAQWVTKERAEHCSPSGTVDQQVWKALAEPWFKLNTDVSYIEDSFLGSWCAVLRDDCGQVVISAWSTMDWCSGNECAEAIASFEDLKIVAMQIYKLIKMESDSRGLVTKLKSPRKSTSMINGTGWDKNNWRLNLYLARSFKR